MQSIWIIFLLLGEAHPLQKKDTAPPPMPTQKAKFSFRNLQEEMTKPKILPFRKPKCKTKEKYSPNTSRQSPAEAGGATSFLLTLPTASSLQTVVLFYFIFLKDHPLFVFLAHSNTSLPLWRPNREGTFANQTHAPAPLSPPSHHDLAASQRPLPDRPLSPPMPLAALTHHD